jgi:hypothetical protein
LHTATNVRLHNIRHPVDETLPPHERHMLESCVMPFVRVLRLLGYSPVLAGESRSPRPAVQPPTGKNSRQKVHGTVQDLLRVGLLREHVNLVSTSRAHPAKATVLPDGRVECCGRVFGKPSSAAAYVTSGSVNGWTFWAVETDVGRVTLAALRARLNSSGT